MAATATIHERRATATAALAGLERARGGATLDGEAFDAVRLAECREELSALDAAEIEVARRERATAAEARNAEVAAARQELKASLASYMEAVGRAEEHAKAMADSLA